MFSDNEEDRIRSLIQDEVALAEHGEVVDVYVHSSESDASNHEADIRLAGEEHVRRRLPIAVPWPGSISVPDSAADLPHAVVQFFGGRRSRGVITGWVYTDETRAPLGAAGDVRVRRGTLELELAGDGSSARLLQRSDAGGSPDLVVEVTDGGQIHLGTPGGDMQPVARQGDTVEVTLPDGSTATGEITGGSQDVEST